MSNPLAPGSPEPLDDTGDDARSELQAIARQLRQADSLGPETRRDLASLMEELAVALPSSMSPALTQQLAETSSHLSEALRDRREADSSLLALARQRLEETAGQVESRTPVLAGVLQRLVETLAGIGA